MTEEILMPLEGITAWINLSKLEEFRIYLESTSFCHRNICLWRGLVGTTVGRNTNEKKNEISNGGHA